MNDAPRLGDVWSYPFLWKREERRGETEGHKHRPCALGISNCRSALLPMYDAIKQTKYEPTTGPLSGF